ncbi:restriction endonuclease subunit S [Sorangium sp. So ce136]|uniref:restriction endonuclease subunit S n=1 Tax=Sorangium sp. So ce136 TaxID=3133284 RepID=UPI003F0F246E
MTDAWPLVRLGDLVTIRHGWPFKSEFFSAERGGRPVVVNIGNFRYTGGFRFESTTVKEYTAEYPREYDLRPGDILLVMTCQTEGGEILGIPARVPDDGRKYLHNQRLGKVEILRRDLVDEGFLYWLFLTREFNGALCATASGTKILHTAPSRIEAFRFSLPPLLQQRSIASVLGSLDDKIELNRRMNQTLEAMARALFKSWFVDFDPVRAKMEGRAPAGMDAETAALFPDSFEDSELGPIPRGWRVQELRDRATAIQYGLTTSATSTPTGPRFLRITDIQGGQINWNTVPYCAIRDGDLEKYRVEHGDIFVARTGASTGENVYVTEPPLAVFASYLVRLRFPTPSQSRFVGAFMRTELYKQHVAGCLGGSAQPNASAQALASARTSFPPESVAAAFHEIVAPIDSRKAANHREDVVLGTLRDTLLPRLLSGELRVKEAEELAGAVL